MNDLERAHYTYLQGIQGLIAGTDDHPLLSHEERKHIRQLLLEANNNVWDIINPVVSLEKGVTNERKP